jgi:hypothetical protein
MFELKVVSSRRDTVSGGDALVRLNAPSDSKWTALLNGREATPSSRSATDAAREPLALLTGMRIGKNTLEIRADGVVKAKLELISHPLPLASAITAGQVPVSSLCGACGNSTDANSQQLTGTRDIDSSILFFGQSKAHGRCSNR